MHDLPFRFMNECWQLGRRPRIMGILNVTPDSFSDGGLFATHERAIAQGLRLAADGADIIDVGGESTRPGAPLVDSREEQRRVLPVIRELHGACAIPLSIDTVKADVAAAAVAAGAVIVNDVSGLHRDTRMRAVVRDSGAGCILMHMRGTPDTMQTLTEYGDLVAEISAYFADALENAAAAGLDRDRIVLDPGIGFAKTAAQNLNLIVALRRFRALGRPVLLGPSRKSFIGTLLPGTAPRDRAWGTAAAVTAGVMHGADILRVHDVREMRDVAAVAAALRDAAGQDDRRSAGDAL